MDEFIKLLNQDYELIRYRIKDKEVIFHVKSSKKELACPFCGSKSIHVHSTYQREIQDLPIQNKQVILLVDTRKFFCHNTNCLHKTFAERHPFAASKAKKTDQLVRNIIHTSTQLSSLNVHAKREIPDAGAGGAGQTPGRIHPEKIPMPAGL